MSDSSYDASETETFGFVDDEDIDEGELEDDILESDDYQEADSFGTTPAEERRGTPLDEQLDAEEPDMGEGG